MRPQYFKYRTLFDNDKKTNDVGFALPWKKGNEDNHFLFRLYKKSAGEFAAFYQHHLSFFIHQYPDATQQEFFNHVKHIITDTISELSTRNRYTSKHEQERLNLAHLRDFLTYLDSIDEWFVRSDDKETIERQAAELSRLLAENKKLKEENKKLRELEPKDYIDIREGRQRTLFDLMVQIRDLKLDDGKELTNATTLNIWSKMIARYFRNGGKPMSLEGIKRYFGPQDAADLDKYEPIKDKDKLFNIVRAKKRSL